LSLLKIVKQQVTRILLLRKYQLVAALLLRYLRQYSISDYLLTYCTWRQ